MRTQAITHRRPRDEKRYLAKKDLRIQALQARLGGGVASGLVAGTYLTQGTIRRRMTWLRRLRLGHCTAFPVDFYKQRSAGLHFHKARFFSGRHTEGFGTNEPGDSVSGADSRPGGTEWSGRGPATRPKFLERVVIVFRWLPWATKRPNLHAV